MCVVLSPDLATNGRDQKCLDVTTMIVNLLEKDSVLRAKPRSSYATEEYPEPVE